MENLTYTIRPVTGTDSETGETWRAWQTIAADGVVVDLTDTWAQAVAMTIREFNS